MGMGLRLEESCFTTFPDTEKRVANTTRSGVFLMNSVVFENVVKHSQEFDISPQSTQKLRGKREKSISG